MLLQKNLLKTPWIVALTLSAQLSLAQEPAPAPKPEPKPEQTPAPQPAPAPSENPATPPVATPPTSQDPSAQAEKPPTPPTPVIHEDNCNYDKENPFQFDVNSKIAINLHYLSCILTRLKPLEAKQAFFDATESFNNIRDRGNVTATARIGSFTFSTFTLKSLIDLTRNHITSIVMIREYIGARTVDYVAQNMEENIPIDQQIEFAKQKEKIKGAMEKAQDMAKAGKTMEEIQKEIRKDFTDKSNATTNGNEKQILTDQEVRDETFETLSQALHQLLSAKNDARKIFVGVMLEITFDDGSYVYVRLNQNVHEMEANVLYAQLGKVHHFHRLKNKNTHMVGSQLVQEDVPVDKFIPKAWLNTGILSVGWDKFEGRDGITDNSSSVFLGISNKPKIEDWPLSLYETNRYMFHIFFGYFPVELLGDPWRLSYDRGFFGNLFLEDQEL